MLSEKWLLEFLQNINNVIFDFQELLLDHLLERLDTRLSSWLNRVPLDVDFLEFVCTQESVILSAISSQVDIPQDIFDALTHVHQMASSRNSEERQITVAHENGMVGPGQDYGC